MKQSSMKKLAHGYTTGACAAAAAKGAAQMLRDQQVISEVEVILPRGEAVRFRLHGQRFDSSAASCYVIKEAGDDPDVTNGAEIHATIRFEDAPPGIRPELLLEGGAGIGRVTKPGLAVKPGEWAINPVPRLMIRHGVNEVFAVRVPWNRRVTISIPNGEELAKRTLNGRLGIVGGLSILGTTGIVHPLSTSAWTDTIDAAIDVALACASPAVVLSTGRSSEMAAQEYLAGSTPLPEEAFVMMGDHVGHAFLSASRKGVRDIIVAGQFAKLLKIGCGHVQTHVSSSSVDLGTLAGWIRLELQDGLLADAVAAAHTAREVFESGERMDDLARMVCERVRQFGERQAPGSSVRVILIGYDGKVRYFG